MITIEEHQRRDRNAKARRAMIYRRVIRRLAGSKAAATAAIRREWELWEDQQIASRRRGGR